MAPVHHRVCVLVTAFGSVLERLCQAGWAGEPALGYSHPSSAVCTPPFPGGTSLPLSRPVHEVRFRPRGLAADAVEAAVEEDGGDAETEQEA